MEALYCYQYENWITEVPKGTCPDRTKWYDCLKCSHCAWKEVPPDEQDAAGEGDA